MTTEEFKTNIQEALQSFAKGNLTKNSLELFAKLGYVTVRRAPLDKPTFNEFEDTYISDQKFDETKARVKEWKYVDLLFQLSREEVSQQASLFDTKQVDNTIIETYLFFAIELIGEEYNRTDLSNITREINRLFPMPVMVLFKYGYKLTFSVINRRLHKRDESKDVLEKVTLIKDISIESPLRAHIEILFDLSFQELLNKHQFTNFVELHNAWQKTLNTKELNKRFYSELFNWYLWAVQSVRFPNDLNDDKDDNVYNAESVIRLLTRLIFVWFIKEKNLVPETLFNVKKLKAILKDLKPESEKTSVYYRAILQNLFFATLNTPMDKDITDENKDEKRRFINTLPKTSNDHYLDQTKYRYQDYFINPDKALELFATIPFLNGGLFECLDFKEGNKEIRFDGFSSTEKRQAFVPDKLFFADEFVFDLNTEYGTKGKKYKVEGLINILDSYKFTIAENTPLEEEIALDPELLGKVFENLLASYNPETQTTARKQTGSFYTPREIVNYMVDESLIAYFKQVLKSSSPDKGEVSEGRRGQENIFNPEVSEGRREKLNNLPHLKTFRKELRNNLTPAEAKLWTLLKGKQLEDKKFRRQFSVANYILDFYCPAENLALELDGQGHFEETQAQYDLERDLFLQHTGIKVLRFENKWVWDNPDGLIEEIKRNFAWKDKQPLSQPLADSSPFEGEQLLEKKLRDLFAHTTDLPEFSKTENTALIKAISKAKILDPACGSGAFPMGVLHRLVDLLNKLDPENKHWNELQKQRAIAETAEVFDSGDTEERKIRLEEINKAFDLSMNYPDYARKLFLIENCIYGVDIQQIAIQISKLRFFISLIVDQKVNDSKPNRNILSMPNLETKFVAANTLIGLDKPQQMTLMAGDVERFEKELASIRHKIFFTRKYSAKKALKKKEKEKREELQAALTQSGFSKNVAGQIAGWNPFDPMQSAKFFDPETMFGFDSGFDVIIGNPPYGIVKTSNTEKEILKKYQLYKTADFKINLFALFLEKSILLSKSGSSNSFIIPDSSLNLPAFKKLREYILSYTSLKYISHFNEDVFETAAVGKSVILQYEKNATSKSFLFRSFETIHKCVENEIDIERVKKDIDLKFVYKSNHSGADTLLDKLKNIESKLNTFCEIYDGINPGSELIKDTLITQNKIDKDSKKIIDGKCFTRYSSIEWDGFYIYYNEDYVEKLRRKIEARGESFTARIIKRTNFFIHQKIVTRQTADSIIGTLDFNKFYAKNSVHSTLLRDEFKGKTSLKIILAILNSSLIDWYYRTESLESGRLFPQVKIERLRNLPIVLPTKTELTTEIENIVDELLISFDTQLCKKLDFIIYKLYELTEEEIKIIEGIE
ncbi:MAG TPA: DUF559 domain-containing protein [Bacteroidales bacterium]|nr:DUF559 domain-containing protein [Bacteroidales bacterium]